jgi:hypothetical protein
MTNSEIISAIELYQNIPVFHPLTCGLDSTHRELIGIEVDGDVVLKCLDCDYIQRHIPLDVILHVWNNKEQLKRDYPWLKI